MNILSEERAVTLGEYIAENGATVREAAKVFGISKSTVHTDVSEKLKFIDKKLWRRVRRVLDENKAQRHIRGGMATKEKYLREKKLSAQVKDDVWKEKEKKENSDGAF